MKLGNLYAGAIAGAIASDLILVSPDENLGIIPSSDLRNIPGFLFHVYGDETMTIQTDITDHYVEDNSAIQDHIALKPDRFKLSGYIGELNNVLPPSLEPVQEVVDRLAILPGYLPSLTVTAIRALNKAEQTYKSVAKMAKAALVASGVVFQSQQQETYKLFEDYIYGRQLFYVQTPWGQLQNMAMESVVSIQSDGDKNTTDFEITFKKIRFAETELTTKTTSPKLTGGQKNHGSTTGELV